jgi:hypothetical protein
LQQVHLATLSLPKQLGGPSAAAFGPPSLSDHCRELTPPGRGPARVRNLTSLDGSERRSVSIAAENGTDSGGFPRHGLATFSPRLGVTARGWNVAGRRASANGKSSPAPLGCVGSAAYSARGGRNSLANSQRSGINSAKQA